MVFGEREVKDHKVTFIDRALEWVDADGNMDQDLLPEGDDLTERSVWNIHRIPYNKTVDFWTLFTVMPGMVGEEFLEDVIRPSS